MNVSAAADVVEIGSMSSCFRVRQTVTSCSAVHIGAWRTAAIATASGTQSSASHWLSLAANDAGNDDVLPASHGDCGNDVKQQPLLVLITVTKTTHSLLTPLFLQFALVVSPLSRVPVS